MNILIKVVFLCTVICSHVACVYVGEREIARDYMTVFIARIHVTATANDVGIPNTDVYLGFEKKLFLGKTDESGWLIREFAHKWGDRAVIINTPFGEREERISATPKLYLTFEKKDCVDVRWVMDIEDIPLSENNRKMLEISVEMECQP